MDLDGLLLVDEKRRDGNQSNQDGNLVPSVDDRRGDRQEKEGLPLPAA